MSSRRVISMNFAAAAVGPYSQGVGLGGLVFASGQLPIDPETGAFPEGIAAQTHASLRNLKALLEAGGASLASVVKTTVCLADMDEFAAMNAVFAQCFPAAPPLARLPRDARVEVEAVAAVTTP